jgi:hypothetical protein
MKTLNPDNCLKCPFMYIDYDDFSVGYSVMYVCTLSQFNNNENYIIKLSNNYVNKINTPKWCPIKDGLIIKLK